MTVYGLTDDGFVIKPQSVIRQEMDDYLRANVDAGLGLDDQSVLGNINGVNSDKLAELWELAQAVYNAMYPDSANGASLDSVCSITGTKREASSKTTVTGQVTLNPFKSLPAGSVAHLTDQPNKRFITLAEVPADDGGGTFDVDFEAEDEGATQVVAGQLSEIAEPVSGWTAVTNADPGNTGAVREEDPDLRLTREIELEAQGSTNVDSIRADVSRVAGVIDVLVFANPTGSPDADGRPPYTVHVITRGGAAEDIAQQIFDSKCAGDSTFGGQSEIILDSMGVEHNIKFDFATEKVIHKAIEVETDPLVFDAVTGPAAIKAAMAAYTNQLGVGDDDIYDQEKCAAFDIPGVMRIVDLKIGFTDPPTGTTDITITSTEYASSDVANIDVTVS